MPFTVTVAVKIYLILLKKHLTVIADHVIYELTSIGLTHINEEYGNSSNKYHVGEPFIEQNFGIVDINWDTPDGPLVQLLVFDIYGKEVFKKSLNPD